MNKLIPFDLKDMLKLIYSGRSTPGPDRVRFYTPSLRGLKDIILNFHTTLDANQRVLNPAFVPALRYIELYFIAFLRAYMLACHYDIYRLCNMCPVGFTPSKVEDILKQPIPKLVLDAFRELIRPQVTPGHHLLIPDPTFLGLGLPYDPEAIIRNNVRLGTPDQYLVRFGIFWFSTLGHCFRSTWMTGTEDGQYALKTVSDTKREGLSAQKFSALIYILKKEDDYLYKEFSDKFRLAEQDVKDEKDKKEKEKKIKVKDELEIEEREKTKGFEVEKFECDDGEFDIGIKPKSELLKFDYKLREQRGKWKDTRSTDFHAYPSDFHISSIITIPPLSDFKRVYWMHDFDAVSDKTRDFAMRMLTPIELFFVDDIYGGKIQQSNDLTPTSIAFLGVDIYRGAAPYSIWQFQENIQDRMEGDTTYDGRSYYIARWISSLSESLNTWHFPALTSEGITPAATSALPISNGKQKRRPRRRNKNNKTAGKPAETVKDDSKFVKKTDAAEKPRA